MRISTSQIYDTGSRNLMSNQASLYKIQNQLSTGKKFLSAQDDPVSAAQVLITSQSLAVNTQYADNQANALSQLSYEESQLQAVVKTLQEARELAVSAGNGSYTGEERAKIADELESKFETLLGLANSTDANGYYLFSGYKGSTLPFEKGTDPFTGEITVTYQGDSGQRLLQVGSTRQIAVSDSGDDIFMSGPDLDQDIFTSLQELVTDLKDTSADPAATATTGLTNIDQALQNVVMLRSSVGSRMNEVESLQSISSSLDLQFQARISDLQDLDYEEAISRYIQQNTQLEAAQSSFATISGLSLFNYL